MGGGGGGCLKQNDKNLSTEKSSFHAEKKDGKEGACRRERTGVGYPLQMTDLLYMEATRCTSVMAIDGRP